MRVVPIRSRLLENSFSKVIRYKNQDFATEIIDTAGQDEYTILNSKHFIGVHGYMIVYSVGSKQSFELCRIIRDKILNHLVCECDQNNELKMGWS